MNIYTNTTRNIQRSCRTPHAPDHHTCGCPSYILKDANHSGLGTPKWEPRLRVGVYIEYSPYHADNVALILNLHTDHVSPQFHVVFDDDFTTIAYLDSTDATPNWASLVETSSELATTEQFQLA